MYKHHDRKKLATNETLPPKDLRTIGTHFGLPIRYSSVNSFSRNKFTLYVFILFYFLTGCNAQNSNKLLIERYLYSDAEVGSVMQLSSLGIKPAESICSLQPYQDAVNYEHPERLRVNEYLRTIGYTPSEGIWVLIMVTETTIELLKFVRSKSADFASFPMRDSLSPQPPDNFGATECVSYEQAALFKTQLNDRVYFMFGRTK